MQVFNTQKKQAKSSQQSPRFLLNSKSPKAKMLDTLSPKINSPLLSPPRSKAVDFQLNRLTSQFEVLKDIESNNAKFEKNKKRSLPNLALKSFQSKQRLQKMPLSQKIKVFDLQRRKMASIFGSTTQKIKEILQKMKQSVFVPSGNRQYKTVTGAKIDKQHLNCVKYIEESKKIQSNKNKQKKSKKLAQREDDEDKHLKQFAQKQRYIQMLQNQQVTKYDDNTTTGGSNNQQLDTYLENPNNFEIDKLGKIKEFKHLKFSAK